MKTKYKLCEGITKDSVLSTKWDQSDWDLPKRVLWQETMFDLGFSWCGDPLLQHVDRPALWCDNDMLLTQGLAIDSFFSEDEAKQLFWSDIFEEITPEQSDTSAQEALSEEFSTKEYKYTKKVFEHSWEALQHFTEQGGLYYKSCGGEGYYFCTKEDMVITAHRSRILFIKEELMWWETVSEDKPCYAISSKGRIIKLIGSTSVLGNEGGGAVNCADYRPLTQEQVQDIVSTMEKWK